jgi:hypothetical protein
LPVPTTYICAIEDPVDIAPAIAKAYIWLPIFTVRLIYLCSLFIFDRWADGASETAPVNFSLKFRSDAEICNPLTQAIAAAGRTA